jgi:hypothetical protein
MFFNTTSRDVRQPKPFLFPETEAALVQRRVIERLTRQLGISGPLAQTIAGLAGLGPEEARRG